MESNTQIKNKKAQIGSKITPIVGVIISVIVLFLIFSAVVPEAQTAGDRFVSDACGEAGCSFDTSTRVCEINSSIEGEGIACPNVVDSPPLAGLFSGSGIVILLLMVGLLLIVLKFVLPKRK